MNRMCEYWSTRWQAVLSLSLAVSLWFTSAVPASAAEADMFAELNTSYAQHIQPILKQVCLDCHDAESKEGQLDLARFASFGDIRTDPQPWQKVAEMLRNGEMPPKDSPALTAEQRQVVIDWVKSYLDAEARFSAGDPGPVLLRRLNNAEYTYTIQDITQAQLTPAKEFPVDGAAGEGFTNTGSSLVMSPALFSKYLDAAKQVASHAMLLPDGIRFTNGNTRPNMTSELLSEIRSIYLRHTSGAGDLSKLNSWSVSNPLTATDEDGRVKLDSYITALIEHRQRLIDDRKSARALAAELNLNPKYFSILADMLLSGEPQSLLLDRIRVRYRSVTVADAAHLTADIRAWQNVLWKFNTVAHYGNSRPWQEAVNTFPESVVLRQQVVSAPDASVQKFFLDANIFGSGYVSADLAAKAAVVWKQPRFEFKDHPAIALKDVRKLTALVQQNLAKELPRTELYLAAVAELNASSDQSLDELAKARELDANLLRSWTKYLMLGQRFDPQITGHLTNKMAKVDGRDAINGWGVPATPCFFVNSSGQDVSFSTLTVPAHGVTAHPSPDKHANIAWQSPVDGRVSVKGKVADADSKCGNGAAWQVMVRTKAGIQEIAAGTFNNGGQNEFQSPEVIEIQRGDAIVVSIGPRDRDHSCDTTHVQLSVQLKGAEERIWDLGADVSPDILAGNPHADKFGNAGVWHFFASDNSNGPVADAVALPAGSALSKWRAAALKPAAVTELTELAKSVQAALNAAPDALNEADQAVIRELTNWHGPLGWVIHAQSKLNAETKDNSKEDSKFGIDPASFGKHPAGKPIEANSRYALASEVVSFEVPMELVRGGELVVEGVLDVDSPGELAVELHLTAGKAPVPGQFALSTAPLTRAGSPARAEMEKSYTDFRSYFPAAMCYARIVPVDEVVTLVLFHREDAQLVRLMLTDDDAQRLDRLWEELRFVSQDALVSVTVCEQLIQFATQDRPDLVPIFQEMQKTILERAAAFSQSLMQSEPAQLTAVVSFAEQAYRRPLKESEQAQLRKLYATLREQDMPHEDAIRLTLARVLASPAFLYRLEQPGPEATPVAVNDWELANRLSYFLWSSAPDDELRALAAAGKLHEDATLLAQSKRMLDDDRTRRLAIEFACQWLHVRDFDQHDEKSEQHFPTFGELRGAMYEESIQFFTDLMQNDGSVLDILDADYTYLNALLAQHYGIPNVEGDHWRKVAGMKQYQRGGVLSQATVLSTQSGASRTSPILRGNWVYETILGERLPRPPKNVPQLPENVPAGLTERQLIEKHSSDASCAKCHARIDPFGFALEQFDAIGRLRDKDAENHAIDVSTRLTDGTEIKGAGELRTYLANTRRDDFLRQFSRKLLGYALGRSVQLSDEPLLDKMITDLKANDYRFSVAVEAIVLSEQFRSIRGSKYVGIVTEHPADDSE